MILPVGLCRFFQKVIILVSDLDNLFSNKSQCLHQVTLNNMMCRLDQIKACTIMSHSLMQISHRCHHPWFWRQCASNSSIFVPFVKELAHWSSEAIGTTTMSPCFTYCQKWWCLVVICFIHGQYLGLLAISKAPELSSNTWQCTWRAIISSVSAERQIPSSGWSGVYTLVD